MSDAAQPDEILFRRVAAGDEAAFTALYRRHQGALYRFALHMSGSPAVAEDVVQEVFLVLMREAGGYSPGRGSVSAWLYGIARKQVLRARERRRADVPLEAGIEPAASGDGDPLAGLTRGETIESVRQAVLVLPAHYREVVVLCDLEEMDYAAAAEALGCAVGTVRSRLHRARALLLDRLRAIRGEGPMPRAADPARCVT